MELGHPIDSEQSVSDSVESMEGASVAGVRTVVDPNQPVDRTGPGAVGDESPEEKKKPKQFNFSLYVQSCCSIHHGSAVSVLFM